MATATRAIRTKGGLMLQRLAAAVWLALNSGVAAQSFSLPY
jgi:hypothetical protein